MDLHSYHMLVSWSLHEFACDPISSHVCVMVTEWICIPITCSWHDHCRLCTTGKIHGCVNICKMQIISTNNLVASSGRHEHTRMIVTAVVEAWYVLVCSAGVVLMSCLQGRCVQRAQTAGNTFFVLHRTLLSLLGVLPVLRVCSIDFQRC